MIQKIEVGSRSGKLLVTEYVGKNAKSYHRMWECQCDCGNKKQVREDGLSEGRVKSCGCSRRGQSKSPMYVSWRKMKERCLNPNAVQYPSYGGRGIKVCDRWLNFNEFEEDMKSTYQPGYTLDRIDNDQGYHLENCRWSSHKKQCRNRRSNKLITYKNNTLSVVEMAEKFEIEYSLLRGRLESGWPVERAIEEPKGGAVCKP